MKKTRSVVSLLLTLCLLCFVSPLAVAGAVTITDKNGNTTVIGSNDFSVKFNGNAVNFTDAQPYVDANNRTMIPLRAVTETMGASVDWIQARQTATIQQNGILVEVPAGSDTITITENGNTATVKMDTAAVSKEGRTYVPIRYVAEALGAWVSYSDLFSTVEIYKDVLTPAEITRLHSYYDMTHEEYLKATGVTAATLYGDANSPFAYTLKDEYWLEVYPETAYFSGTYGFENANEWKLRNPNGVEVLKWPAFKVTSYTGVTSGLKYTYGTQPDIDFTNLVLAEAHGVEKEINSQGKIHISLRSDLSCVYASRHSNAAGTWVRGVLTVKIPENADIPWITSKYDFIPNPKAGETRDIDVEIDVNTFTPDVHWSIMNALK